MKSIVKDLEQALATPLDEGDANFIEQVRRIRDFKKKLDEAGVEVKPETMPDTMTLIGHLSEVGRKSALV